MRLVGAVAFSLGLGLIACGGSSGRETPDGTAGSGGRVGAGGGGAGGVPSAAGGATGDDAAARDASDAETGAPLADAPAPARRRAWPPTRGRVASRFARP